MLKILTIVGARPQIIKSSAISRAIDKHFSGRLKEVIVHTGQHYDENMSEIFFTELGIPAPVYNLETGSGSHGAQTAKMLEGLENVFSRECPDAVLVYGDTNSTIAGALAASKMHIPVIHVEAGLRSFNKSMPEEINRIACDHMSTLLFTPTKKGLENLEKEGFVVDSGDRKVTIDRPGIYYCGDIMLDNSYYFSDLSDQRSTILEQNDLQSGGYILVTVHRDSNTDIAENMEQIFSALREVRLRTGLEIVLPLHPRTRSKMAVQLSAELFGEIESDPGFKIIPPAGFLDIIALEKNARLIVTDSGGLQKEAFFFKKPCVILRPQTEWVEIVENGNALLAGSDRQLIIEAVEALLANRELDYPPFYGDGNAAIFICEKILSDLK